MIDLLEIQKRKKEMSLIIPSGFTVNSNVEITVRSSLGKTVFCPHTGCGHSFKAEKECSEKVSCEKCGKDFISQVSDERKIKY